MAQKNETAQHGQVRHAENLGHRRVGGWHGGQPQQAHHAGKYVDARGAQWCEQEDGDHDRPCEVDERQDVCLLHVLPEHARAVSPEHVEQADQGQCVTRDLRRQALVLEITGHMHADEYDLEAAHEVTRHQQLETGVLERLAQGLQDGLLAPGRCAGRITGLPQPDRQRCHQQRRKPQHHQRLLPAQRADQEPLCRHHQELAERPCRGRDAHRP